MSRYGQLDLYPSLFRSTQSSRIFHLISYDFHALYQMWGVVFCVVIIVIVVIALVVAAQAGAFKKK